jgi:hypothetical protein
VFIAIDVVVRPKDSPCLVVGASTGIEHSLKWIFEVECVGIGWRTVRPLVDPQRLEHV